MTEPATATATATLASKDNLANPGICIPHVKMTIGRGEFSRPVTQHFIQSAFSRYGEIEEVVMKLHSPNSNSRACAGNCGGYGGYGRAHIEEKEEEDEYHYYRVHIHFKRWHIENGEARYVRSVLLSSNTDANIKLAYDGPWYWKFYAARRERGDT
jgi:hypothetical protein